MNHVRRRIAHSRLSVPHGSRPRSRRSSQSSGRCGIFLRESDVGKNSDCQKADCCKLHSFALAFYPVGRQCRYRLKSSEILAGSGRKSDIGREFQSEGRVFSASPLACPDHGRAVWVLHLELFPRRPGAVGCTPRLFRVGLSGAPRLCGRRQMAARSSSRRSLPVAAPLSGAPGPPEAMRPSPSRDPGPVPPSDVAGSALGTGDRSRRPGAT
jgi:hypothetical protein